MIFPISFRLNFLQCAEIQEVVRPVSLMVEGEGICQLHTICHALIESDTLEVEIPTAHIWHHVEAHEPATHSSSAPTSTNALVCRRAGTRRRCTQRILHRFLTLSTAWHQDTSKERDKAGLILINLLSSRSLAGQERWLGRCKFAVEAKPSAQWPTHRGEKVPVAQQHLHFLVVCGLVACRVLPCLLGLPAPLIAPRGEFVGCQRTRARCEGASDCHTALAVPTLVIL